MKPVHPEDPSDGPPVIPLRALETGRTVGTFVFALTGVALLGWPVAAFVAIFIFDAPIRDAADEAFRYSMVGAIWGYPAFWGVGLALHRAALKQRKIGAPLYWPMALPLVPIVYLTAIFAFGG
jgi:hypothetical protein